MTFWKMYYCMHQKACFQSTELFFKKDKLSLYTQEFDKDTQYVELLVLVPN